MSRAQLTAQTCDVLTDRLTQPEPWQNGSADLEAEKDLARINREAVAVPENAAGAPFVRITSGCAHDVILGMPTKETQLAFRQLVQVQRGLLLARREFDMC